MVIYLSNEDVKSLAEFGDIVNIMEDAYVEAGRGRATSAPRIDTVVPSDPPAEYHMAKMMSGALPKYNIQAVRLDSDLIRWRKVGKHLRRETVTKEIDESLRVGKENGLVLLFSSETAELKAIMPDGEMQRRRVAATHALAAKRLSPKNPNRVAFFGSGYQAKAGILTFDAIFNLNEIRVFSPTKEHRDSLVNSVENDIQADIISVDHPLDAIENVDVIQAMTNALDPVVEPDWVKPGLHIGSIRTAEIHNEIFNKVDHIVFNSVEQKGAQHVTLEADQLSDGLRHEIEQGYPSPPSNAVGLQDVMANNDFKSFPDSTTSVFVNNVGLGIQFAAAGHVVLQKFQTIDVGHELPDDWFLQDVPQP